MNPDNSKCETLLQNFLRCSILIHLIVLSLADTPSNETVTKPTTKNLSNGFGDLYEWHSFDQGLARARSEGLPLMLILHRSYCPACKVLKDKFSVSEKALKYSKYLVMVNIVLERELQERKFFVDGKYVPRIYFLDWKGDVHPEIYNAKGNPDYKFFYYDVDHLVESMKRAVTLLTVPRSAKEL